jgi:CRP/FNR family transcriptional regulator
VAEWSSKYPDINSLFFQLYNVRYLDLLNTLNHVIFDKLDSRILEYLKQRSEVVNSKKIKISHRQIAQDLGTAREVVSRLLKKMEADKSIRQADHFIEIL